MKLNIAQRSKEWNELRRGKIGASDIAIIMGNSPWSSVHDLLEGKFYKKEKPVNGAMQTGIDNEEMILDLIQCQLKIGLVPAVYVHDEKDFAMASLDGVSTTEDLIVEIKSPQAKSHQSFKDNGIPLHYQQQMQWQMLVSGISKSLFASWYNGDLYLQELSYNELEALELLEKGEAFFLEILAPFAQIMQKLQANFSKK